MFSSTIFLISSANRIFADFSRKGSSVLIFSNHGNSHVETSSFQIRERVKVPRSSKFEVFPEIMWIQVLCKIMAD